jgi:hypothetical protein
LYLIVQKLKASQVMADAEVAAAEKLLLAAEIESARAQQLKDQLVRQVNAVRDIMSSEKVGS